MFLRPLRLIPEKTNIDFVKARFVAFFITLALIVATTILLFTKGLNLGTDFTGGVLIEAKSSQEIDIGTIRKDLATLELGEVDIQQFGAPEEILIRIQRQDGDDAAQMSAVQSVRDKLGEGYEYKRVEVVGPTVGGELLAAGILAAVLAMVGMSIYVAFRFEWQFGVAAMVSTFHDVFVTVGLFSLFQLDFNLTSVAVFLTLAGYSINDTIIIFDRMREILRRHKADNLKEIINIAVNQTLSRTIMTGGTTMLAILPLLFIGGSTLFGFAVAMTWGILIGTYSSIYVAASLLLYMPRLRRIDPSHAKKKKKG